METAKFQMIRHLSKFEIEQLCVSALPEDELVGAAVHSAECQSCNQRFIEELKLQRGSTPFSFTLEPKFWFRHDHVDFGLLVALADKTLDHHTEEIINIHLQTCATCREDVRVFLDSRDTTAREMGVVYSPSHYEPLSKVRVPVWWQRVQPTSVYAVAAIVLIAVAVFIGVIALNRNAGSLEADKNNQTNPRSEPRPSSFTSPAPNAGSTPSSDDTARVATLRDRVGEVTIDRNGGVTGLDQVSETSKQYVARAALSERIEPGAVLKRLSGDQSGLRGTANGRQDFRLLYPVRSVIIDDRPVFRWNNLPGVSGYQVYVLNGDGKQVSQSEELPPTQTQWKTPFPLRRGEIFSWVVTALVDGKKVVSPSASDPEIKFAVLSASDFRELSRLKKFNSHLALGVFYARTGLLDQAEREFKILSKLNPDSELPRKLLQSVRDKR